MYLRLFADSSGQVRLVARDEPTRTHLSAVHNAVTEAGFYRIEIQELAREEDRVSFDPEGVEEGLSSLEGAAKPAITKLISSGLTQFDDADWYRLYQFVALQTVRGNRWRAQLSTAITRSVRNAYVKDGVVPRDAAFPRIIPPKALVVQESLKMGLGTGENGDIGLSRYLIEKGVRLVRPSTTSVLTSDEPVCWWTPNTGASGYAQTPIVWLPLTPRLIVQFRDPEFDEIQHGVPADDDERAEFINGLVATQAERWIVHHPADTPSLGDRLPPRVSSSAFNPAQ